MNTGDCAALASYCGRFAPSPTGPLHFGSLVAALGSYLDARAAGGAWLLRIEDVDTPRSVPGAADAILRALDQLGFSWDAPPVWQSRPGCQAAYAEALERLRAAGWIYPCACSRREIAGAASTASIDGGPRYSGICRAGLPPGREARAWRLCVPEDALSFNDRIHGAVTQQLERDVGDFVLFRADGLYAYHLAVVVDDAEAGITDIVRGADLIDSTPRQIWLQRCLGVPTPRYAHLPLASNAAGEKLSKQTLAPALDAGRGAALLADALRFLGHEVPAQIAAAPVAEFWSWAIAHWQIAQVPRERNIASTF
ncbi:MAG: tRNA glutamyl-Q(34) synthetase GluQRS [Betaproteobacteria bacterium]|nr:tRNA glutamyl-Q(34) synthetase GluQRS [Betaproteobacteria bacterium]